jgi:hypothetical protein
MAESQSGTPLTEQCSGPASDTTGLKPWFNTTS